MKSSIRLGPGGNPPEPDAMSDPGFASGPGFPNTAPPAASPGTSRVGWREVSRPFLHSIARSLAYSAVLGLGALVCKDVHAQSAEPPTPQQTLAVPTAPLGASAATEPATTAAWQFSGYNKTIAISSSSMDPDNRAYDMALNRLRLKLNYEVPHFQAHIEEDVTVQAGSYLRTPDFQKEKNAPSRQYWKDGSVFGDTSAYFGTQRLFRAYAKFSADAADLTIGRQRIPLGTGRMWSTLDMLNPINPLQVERDEYVGVDAALLEYRIGQLSRLSLIYAPDPARVSDRWVGQYRSNLKGTDVTFTYGKYWSDHIAGVDFATQIGDAGLRGEWTYTRPQIGRSYEKMLLGFDYAFDNTLTISSELYYSNQRKEDRLTQFSQNAQLAQVQPLSNRYVGLSASYEITPLLKAGAIALFNLSDHGRFLSPTLSYSVSDNLVLSGGAQFFSGTQESDYGRGKNLRYVQVQWFF